MPFFNKVYSLQIGEEATEILNLAPGVCVKALRIFVDGAHGAVAYISAHPDAATTGIPLYSAIAYNGVATDPMTGGSISFTAEELKCLTREEKRLFASAGGTAVTVHVFGVIEY